jgi:hypothetical protein
LENSNLQEFIGEFSRIFNCFRNKKKISRVLDISGVFKNFRNFRNFEKPSEI